ncbi:MAG: Rv1355c family protein [Myxococcota bacterium]
MNLERMLVSHVSPESESFRPQLFGAEGQPLNALEFLLAEGHVASVHDTIVDQVAELMEIRNPERSLTGAEVIERAKEHLGGEESHNYGTWVYYPWSRRLVHVLPRDEFIEVRESRNRNKISAEEQLILRRAVIGVVGLSVGRATAVTLAMEGIGSTFRIADFDALSLSNLNRLRAGVHDLGVNKAILAAREIYQHNPYLRVEALTEGVNARSLGEFLGSGEGQLDLLFEECDDLAVKLLVREHARERGIPVVMETSDRGLVDVERFDQEPGRAILHGLVGDTTADQLHGLDTEGKVPLVARILGIDSLSPRLAASMVEIKSTLTSWPQLASDVALGGAINANVARRILLDELPGSGRWYIDLDERIRPERAHHAVAASEPDDVDGRSIPVVPGPAPSLHVRGEMDEEAVRELVHCAVLAPSGGNCQPWRFDFDGDRLRCVHDRERSESLLDFENRGSYLAIGAALENATMAAAAMGFETQWSPFPEPLDSAVVCDLRFRSRRPVEIDPLLEWVPLRVTNRRLSAASTLNDTDLKVLDDAARSRGAELTMLTQRDPLARIGKLLGRGDRLRLLHAGLHREMVSELRWNRTDTETSRDGIDVETLELTSTDRVGLWLTRAARTMMFVNQVGGGRKLESSSQKAVAASAGVGLVHAPGETRLDYLEGGRAMQRVWLAANARGLAFQPMTALVYMFARMRSGGGGFDPDLCARLSELEREHRSLFQVSPNRGELMVFRLSRAGAPTARALRRPIEDVLTFSSTSHLISGLMEVPVLAEPSRTSETN